MVPQLTVIILALNSFFSITLAQIQAQEICPKICMKASVCVKGIDNFNTWICPNEKGEPNLKCILLCNNAIEKPSTTLEDLLLGNLAGSYFDKMSDKPNNNDFEKIDQHTLWRQKYKNNYVIMDVILDIMDNFGSIFQNIFHFIDDELWPFLNYRDGAISNKGTNSIQNSDLLSFNLNTILEDLKNFGEHLDRKKRSPILGLEKVSSFIGSLASGIKGGKFGGTIGAGINGGIGYNDGGLQGGLGATASANTYGDIERVNDQPLPPDNQSINPPNNPCINPPNNPCSNPPNNPNSNPPNDPSISPPNDPSISSPNDPSISPPNDPSISPPNYSNGGEETGEKTGQNQNEFDPGMAQGIGTGEGNTSNNTSNTGEAGAMNPLSSSSSVIESGLNSNEQTSNGYQNNAMLPTGEAAPDDQIQVTGGEGGETSSNSIGMSGQEQCTCANNAAK